MRRARPPQTTRQIRRIEPPGPQPVGVATLTRSTRWKPAAFWLILLTVGVAALGIAMAFASRRNSQRTAQEKRVTDAATRQVYREEDRDAS